MEHPFRDLRQACDAVATAAENTAAVFRQRANDDSFDRPDLRVAAQGWDQLAVELREISIGEGSVRATPMVATPYVPVAERIKCSQCGISLERSLGYVCTHASCPTGLGGATS